MGTVADVDLAVDAARRAFSAYSMSSVKERLELLQRILHIYTQRYNEIAVAISEEMGAPITIAHEDQARTGLAHLEANIQILQSYAFEERDGSTLIRREPIGVCALITPWNWPINQVVCKVLPALATGCSVILKPSEIAPFSTYIFC